MAHYIILFKNTKTVYADYSSLSGLDVKCISVVKMCTTQITTNLYDKNVVISKHWVKSYIKYRKSLIPQWHFFGVLWFLKTAPGVRFTGCHIDFRHSCAECKTNITYNFTTINEDNGINKMGGYKPFVLCMHTAYFEP